MANKRRGCGLEGDIHSRAGVEVVGIHRDREDDGGETGGHYWEHTSSLQVQYKSTLQVHISAGERLLAYTQIMVYNHYLLSSYA